MPGCFVAPDECAPPDDDPQSTEDDGKEQKVRDLIDALWNYRWTDGDRSASQASRDLGGPPVMPTPAETALGTLVHGDYTRHRRDGSGTRKKGTGVEGLIDCVELVHGSVSDLKITILDIVVCGDCVTALILIEGTDLRPNGQTGVPGLFGAASPTGRGFRATTAVMYCFENGVIRDDYLLYGCDMLFLGHSYVGHLPPAAV